jgi:HAMP domain-containing protein
LLGYPDRPSGIGQCLFAADVRRAGAAYAWAIKVQIRIAANNPDLAQAARLAVLAWDLRDWSGRQTTTLISYIARHLPMAGEQAEALAEYKGRIDQKWWAISAAAASVDGSEVMAAMTGVERGYWARGGEAYATQVVPNRGRTLNLDPDGFTVFIRPILDTILPLRDSALSEALQRGNADIATCRNRFLLALALALLTVAAAAAATSWFDRWVVRPVEQITTVILDLASGNRDVRIPLQSRTDELGRMAKAIEALRCNAIQAEAVGHEILVLQQERAEESAGLCGGPRYPTPGQPSGNDNGEYRRVGNRSPVDGFPGGVPERHRFGPVRGEARRTESSRFGAGRRSRTSGRRRCCVCHWTWGIAKVARFVGVRRYG